MDAVKQAFGNIDSFRPRIVAVFGKSDSMLARGKDFGGIGALHPGGLTINGDIGTSGNGRNLQKAVAFDFKIRVKPIARNQKCQNNYCKNDSNDHDYFGDNNF